VVGVVAVLVGVVATGWAAGVVVCLAGAGFEVTDCVPVAGFRGVLDTGLADVAGFAAAGLAVVVLAGLAGVVVVFGFAAAGFVCENAGNASKTTMIHTVQGGEFKKYSKEDLFIVESFTHVCLLYKIRQFSASLPCGSEC